MNWTPPAGEAETVTSYRITPYIGSTAQSPTTVTAPATSKAVTGLTAGTAYTFTVTAINPAGAGPESAKSNSVTPTGAGIPEAPTGAAAEARNQSAVVSWTPGRRWRQPDHRLPDHPLHRIHRAVADDGVRSGHVGDRQRPRQRHQLHLHRHRPERRRGGPAFGRVERGDAARDDLRTGRYRRSSKPLTRTRSSSGSSSPATSAGTIRGIRFYKVGRKHRHRTWSASGAPPVPLLAQATASGETESGWQEVAFASPVPIAANTTYVAAYLAPDGHYSATSQAFETAIDSPPAARRRQQRELQRRLRLQRHQHLPVEHLQRDQLLGRRPVHAMTRIALILAARRRAGPLGLRRLRRPGRPIRPPAARRSDRATTSSPPRQDLQRRLAERRPAPRGRGERRGQRDRRREENPCRPGLDGSRPRRSSARGFKPRSARRGRPASTSRRARSRR